MMCLCHSRFQIGNNRKPTTTGIYLFISLFSIDRVAAESIQTSMMSDDDDEDHQSVASSDSSSSGGSQAIIMRQWFHDESSSSCDDDNDDDKRNCIINGGRCRVNNGCKAEIPNHSHQQQVDQELPSGSSSPLSSPPPLSKQQTSQTSLRQIMHVAIEERQMGADRGLEEGRGGITIAEKVWPAAEYLARFCLQCANGSSREEWGEEDGGGGGGSGGGDVEDDTDGAGKLSPGSYAATDQTVPVKVPKSGSPHHHHHPLQASARQAVYTILRRAVEASSSLSSSVSTKTTTTPALAILELGAGVGVTGLELATQWPVAVLLTDLPQCLAGAQNAIELNRSQFRRGTDAVHVQALCWGCGGGGGNHQSLMSRLEPADHNPTIMKLENTSSKSENQRTDYTVDEKVDDCIRAMQWYRCVTAATSSSSSSTEPNSTVPLLILGSDCVYWEVLHESLERTLFHLLSLAPAGSLCLLAGMRRWKRDTAFYHNLGKRTRTKHHSLSCVCIQESVQRVEGKREIIRIYAVSLLNHGGSDEAKNKARTATGTIRTQ